MHFMNLTLNFIVHAKAPHAVLALLLVVSCILHASCVPVTTVSHYDTQGSDESIIQQSPTTSSYTLDNPAAEITTKSWCFSTNGQITADSDDSANLTQSMLNATLGTAIEPIQNLLRVMKDEVVTNAHYPRDTLNQYTVGALQLMGISTSNDDITTHEILEGESNNNLNMQIRNMLISKSRDIAFAYQNLVELMPEFSNDSVHLTKEIPSFLCALEEMGIVAPDSPTHVGDTICSLDNVKAICQYALVTHICELLEQIIM